MNDFCKIIDLSDRQVLVSKNMADGEFFINIQVQTPELEETDIIQVSIDNLPSAEARRVVFDTLDKDSVLTLLNDSLSFFDITLK